MQQKVNNKTIHIYNDKLNVTWKLKNCACNTVLLIVAWRNVYEDYYDVLI